MKVAKKAFVSRFELCSLQKTQTENSALHYVHVDLYTGVLLSWDFVHLNTLNVFFNAVEWNDILFCTSTTIVSSMILSIQHFSRSSPGFGEIARETNCDHACLQLLL